VVTLGRALDNDIVLEDSRVSRYHAELRLEGERCRVRDLRSTNGTLVNGRAIAEVALAPGDLISIGGLELRLESEKMSGRRRGS
jgi:pSer/pThr/pTyr-binding forkhead associated (FHA) protein